MLRTENTLLSFHFSHEYGFWKLQKLMVTSVSDGGQEICFANLHAWNFIPASDKGAILGEVSDHG